MAHNSTIRLLPDMGLVVKYKSQYYFFILGKTNDKKNPILRPFWPNMNFPGKILQFCQFLNIPIIYHHAKKSEKANAPFLKKMPN